MKISQLMQTAEDGGQTGLCPQCPANNPTSTDLRVASIIKNQSVLGLAAWQFRCCEVSDFGNMDAVKQHSSNHAHHKWSHSIQGWIYANSYVCMETAMWLKTYDWRDQLRDHGDRCFPATSTTICLSLYWWKMFLFTLCICHVLH